MFLSWRSYRSNNASAGAAHGRRSLLSLTVHIKITRKLDVYKVYLFLFLFLSFFLFLFLCLSLPLSRKFSLTGPFTPHFLLHHSSPRHPCPLTCARRSPQRLTRKLAIFICLSLFLFPPLSLSVCSDLTPPLLVVHSGAACAAVVTEDTGSDGAVRGAAATLLARFLPPRHALM